MKLYLKSIIVFGLALTLFSCNDVIEEDIRNVRVNLYAPANGSANSYKSQTFWWEEIEEADLYNLQVVESTFENPTRLILDSNVTTNQFTYPIEPGKYQWRVRAENGGYESYYSTYSLQVDSSFDISNELVTLSSPINSDTVNNVVSVEFIWDRIKDASYYTIYIEAQNDDKNPTISVTDITTNRFTTTQLPEEDIDYIWRVKATYDNGNGDISETVYSSYARFRVRIPVQNNTTN